MNVTRTLVTTLLISSVIMGFVQGLSTQSASGVITTTSTTTSTYYSYWTGTTVSTRFMITTARTLTQTNYEGPYVKLEGPIRASYGGTGLLQDFFFDLKIWNLLKVPIESGELLIELYNSARTVTETLRVSFGGIKVGEYVVLQHRAPVTKNFYENDFHWRMVMIVIICGGVVVEAPVATYTLAGTQTYTYVTTGTIAYTLSEPQSPLSYASVGFVVLMVFGAAATMTVVYFFSLRKHGPGGKEEMSAKTSTKACVKCSSQLPVDAEYCSECGERQV